MGLFSRFVKGTFSHGIHLPAHKTLTARLPIKRLPFPPLLILPLSQHIGAPSKVIVKKGQEVVRGQPVAEADGALSVPLHAPASGRIKNIDHITSANGVKEPAIFLQVYEASTQEVLWRKPLEDINNLDQEHILQAIQDCGLVGLGGAAFPSHFKLKIPEDQSVDTLIINGCECEPFLTCDHRIMLEYPEQVIQGIRYAMLATGTQKAMIGVEDNKLNAVRQLKKLLWKDPDISAYAIETKYPQGAEKMLIKSLLNREVPTGGIPANIGVVVNNVNTMSELGQLLAKGEGLIERIVTVTGPGVKRPGNYIVPIGTPIGFILDQLGCDESANRFVLGGPMMGPAVSSMDTPITKGCAGLLVLNEPEIEDDSPHIWPCIKCARCVNACPMHLNPAQLGQLASAAEYEEMAARYNLNHCFECGCCSYVCPSRIPLVQYFRIAKAINREQAA